MASSLLRVVISFIILGLTRTAGSRAAGQPVDGGPYQEIRVALPLKSSLSALVGELGAERADVEILGLGDGDVRLLSRPSLTRDLMAKGWRVTILHPDLEEFYASRQRASAGFGVWHTYDETVAELAQLHAEYPEITSEPAAIGLSVQGREILAIKISDHPEIEEDEPEVLFDGVHHAREIMSVEVILYLARYLCENYATDPLVQYLVNNRQIYLVPIVNPDGFVYNETIRPGGGGMWRKNRRPSPSGCFGVDNNRNYPYQWGLDSGSSGRPCDDTYRGTSPGSEPETRAMMQFMERHRVVTHNSIHSVAGMVLLPWGYTPEPTPDDSILRTIAGGMASANLYRIGQPPEILYMVSGGFFDWAYGEQDAKPKVFSFTTEIGGTGFWPDPSEKDGLLQENFPSMLYLAQAAGSVVSILDPVLASTDGETGVAAGDTLGIVLSVANAGLLAETGDILIRLRCDDPYIALLHASARLETLAPGTRVIVPGDSLRFRIDPDCPQGRQITFTFGVRAGSAQALEVPFLIEVGQLPALFADDFETAGDEWIKDESSDAGSGDFVRADPNPTPYQPGDDTTPAPGTTAWITGQNSDEGNDDVDQGIAAARSPDIDLVGHPDARLSMRYFFGQRDAGDDPQGDWFRIDLSPDRGSSWINLAMIGDQASQPTWRSLTLNLGDLVPQADRVRIRVQASDGPMDGDLIEAGIDDVFLFDPGTVNVPPSPPILVAPTDTTAGLSARPVLRVRNATDAEGDPLTYGFRVYADSNLTSLAASSDGIVQATGGETSWKVSQKLHLGAYHWRAYAADPTHRGLYGAIETFTVVDTTSEEPPATAAAILRARPNPTKDGIRIRYFLPATSMSRLAVYDPQGRLVRRIESPGSAVGWREAFWDGKDDADRPAASGAYWVRLWTPEETRTVQVIRIR